MEGPNRNRSSSAASSDSGIEADLTPDTSGSGFQKRISSFSPSESSLQGREYAKNLPATKITDRIPSHLSNKQKLKLGLLKLTSHFLSGKKTRNWLAGKALKLMNTAITAKHGSLVVKLDEFIAGKLFPLDEKQHAEYDRLSNQYISAASEDLQVADSDFPDDDGFFNSGGRLAFMEDEPETLASEPDKRQ